MGVGDGCTWGESASPDGVGPAGAAPASDNCDPLSDRVKTEPVVSHVNTRAIKATIIGVSGCIASDKSG